MTKGRCKTCKWSKNAPSLLFETYRMKCDHPKFVYDEKLPTDGVEMWGCEGYSTGFYVGPEFGCIHWEKRNVG